MFFFSFFYIENLAKFNPQNLAKLIEFGLEKKIPRISQFLWSKNSGISPGKKYYFFILFLVFRLYSTFTCCPSFSLFLLFPIKILIIIIIIINIVLLHLTAVDMDPTATSALRLGFAGECDEVFKTTERGKKTKTAKTKKKKHAKEIVENSRKKRERGERHRHRQESNQK